MSIRQKRCPNPQGQSAKHEDLLRSLFRTLEGEEMEVAYQGTVKNAGGVKGVNIDYSFSLRNLTPNSCMTNRDKHVDYWKHRKPSSGNKH